MLVRLAKAFRNGELTNDLLVRSGKPREESEVEDRGERAQKVEAKMRAV